VACPPCLGGILLPAWVVFTGRRGQDPVGAGLLLRFRTLFNLPGVVRSLAKEKDYEGAVHEYLKAKSINIPGHVSPLVYQDT